MKKTFSWDSITREIAEIDPSLDADEWALRETHSNGVRVYDGPEGSMSFEVDADTPNQPGGPYSDPKAVAILLVYEHKFDEGNFVLPPERMGVSNYSVVRLAEASGVSVKHMTQVLEQMSTTPLTGDELKPEPGANLPKYTVVLLNPPFMRDNPTNPPGYSRIVHVQAPTLDVAIIKAKDYAAKAAREFYPKIRTTHYLHMAVFAGHLRILDGGY